MTTPLVFILYDGIENSVFTGQVLEPLRAIALQNPQQKIFILSFESKNPSPELIDTINQHKQFDLRIFRRYPFTCTASLWPAIKTMKDFLATLTNYTIIARGPHAGWIALYASSAPHCKHITLQARGLLAEEFIYTKPKNGNIFSSWLTTCRIYSFKKLEKKVYTFSANTMVKIPTIIEAVSPALKDYISTHYKTDPAKITIAHHDIPKPIGQEQHQQWRAAVRAKLGIACHTHVYCYNGSIKPWACPEHIIEFFSEQQKKEKNSFLLVLTQEKKQFLTLLQQHAIDPSHYFVCTVHHNEVYHYLAASDSGIIFREKNILNWVSRPTKVLEYQAAGLNIIHNNTVALLVLKQ